MRRSIAVATALAAAVLATTACAPGSSSGTQAEEPDYPTRPIELVVPFDPGGGTDITARVMAAALSDELGVPVNVTNKPGAEQITGVDSVRKADPDGYTLLADGAGSSSIQALSENVPFDWDDRTFIGRLTAGAHVYAVAADSPYKSLDDLIKALSDDPKSFRIKWAGGATTSDLTMAALLEEAGVALSDLTQVPFNSSGDTMESVVAGDLDVGVGGASSAFAFGSSGDLRILAQTGTEPIEQLGDIPTTEEEGYPDLDLTFWVGLAGPPGMNDAVRERLEEALTTIAEDPAVLEKLANAGVAASPLVGQPFEEYVRSEVDVFAKLRENVGGAE